MNPILLILLILIYSAPACALGGQSIKKLSFQNQDQPEKTHHIIATLERDDHLSVKIDGKPVITADLNFSSIPPVNFAAGLFQGKPVVIDCSRSKLPYLAKETTCNVNVNGNHIGLLTFSLML